MVQAGGLYWLIRPSNESALGRLIGCRASCQAGTSTRMLAVGDKSDRSSSDVMSPTLGVMDSIDSDDDAVLISLPDAEVVECLSPMDGTAGLKEARDYSPFHCLNNLDESSEGMQEENDISSESIESGSSSGSSEEEEEDLCEGMNKLSTFKGMEKESTPRKELSDSFIFEWHVGDLCVCRWHVDKMWYFAEITRTNHSSAICGVRFLHFGAKQDTHIDELHPVNALTLKWVRDEDNVLATQAMIIFSRLAFDIGFRKPPTKASTADPGKSALQLCNIHVGELCVCQFSGGVEFLFGKVVAINVQERMCKVAFLLRRKQQYCVPFEDIYPCYSEVAKMVTNDANVIRMQRELVRQIRMPMLEPFLGAKAGESDVKKEQVRGKRGTLKGKWKNRSGLTGSQTLRALPHFWRFLLLELCGNDKKAVLDMINSWYMCGYQSGYTTALKNGKDRRV
ncbi:hypothetical protein TcWFU_007246 [Taenia crassiceps]|uniref:Tudor domain-containing protein n=1 Tax=Taenia crassiceps TaxID=6207 RepID=A0ABR4QLW8_9CEST